LTKELLLDSLTTSRWTDTLKQKTLVDPLLNINWAAIIYPSDESGLHMLAIVCEHWLRFPLHKRDGILL
jgi:hypothetical protein